MSAFWTMVTIGLAGAIAYQSLDERSTLSTVVAAPPERSPGDEPVYDAATLMFPSEELIADIVARPLFSPSRRPPPPIALHRDDGDEVTDDKPVLELIGTILVGERHIALLKHPTEGVIRRKPGERIGDWKLVDVRDQRVRLESEDGQEFLTLRKDLAKPAVARSLSKPKVKSGVNDETKKPAPAPEQPAQRRI
ncbi:MAG: hypothetical protein ACR2RE_29020 [Geminicoccaceae bacterium]